MLAEMLPIRDPFFFGDGILRAITELDKWLYVFLTLIWRTHMKQSVSSN